jgi:hypothetical protein
VLVRTFASEARVAVVSTPNSFCWPEPLSGFDGRIKRGLQKAVCGAMAIPYHHKQCGTLILAVCLILALLSAGTAWQSGQWAAAIVSAVLVTTGFLFSSLTVSVSERELRWYFGPGLWSYRLPVDEIGTVAVVRNQWWNGYGIRMRPGFRLYNVSGLDAVELRLNSGDVRRIGTDDPAGLYAALSSPEPG